MNQPTSYYTIKSKHSGRVLDICQDTDKKGQLIIYDGCGTDNQIFSLRQQGLEVEIVSKKSNKILTIATNSPKNGAPIVEDSAQGLPGQRFRIQESSPGSNEYIIFTFCGKVLDCCQASKDNGTKIIQWEFNGGSNQKWELKKI